MKIVAYAIYNAIQLPEFTIAIIAAIAKWTSKYIKPLLGLLLATQSLAFVSFIYEESLQAHGFAARAAMSAEDPITASACLRDFRTTMDKAQRFQSNWGWLTFWTNTAYHQYFFFAAPGQLRSYISQGCNEGLWNMKSLTLRVVDTPDGVRIVDYFELDAEGQISADGFELEPHNRRGFRPDVCVYCRQRLTEADRNMNRSFIMLNDRKNIAYAAHTRCHEDHMYKQQLQAEENQDAAGQPKSQN